MWRKASGEPPDCGSGEAGSTPARHSMTTIYWCDRCEHGWLHEGESPAVCPRCQHAGYRMGEFPAKVAPHAARLFLPAEEVPHA